MAASNCLSSRIIGVGFCFSCRLLYASILIKMGKRGERKDSSNSDASSEEYVVEKVLNKRVVKGKVSWIFPTGSHWTVLLYFQCVHYLSDNSHFQPLFYTMFVINSFSPTINSPI